MQLLSLVIMRSKHNGQLEGYGFLKFADHTTATHILKSYNGQKMPNADQDFCLNWATQKPAPDKLPHQDSKLAIPQDAQAADADAASAHAIFVGDLSYDVNDFMLHHLFKSRYPSVKSAKVIIDKLTGRSKGFGFIHFGDANEQVQAMKEMNGAYCSTRPIRTGPAPNNKTTGPASNKKSTYTYHPSNPCFNLPLIFKFLLLSYFSLWPFYPALVNSALRIISVAYDANGATSLCLLSLFTQGAVW